jgi:hypothetical protein
MEWNEIERHLLFVITIGTLMWVFALSVEIRSIKQTLQKRLAPEPNVAKSDSSQSIDKSPLVQ